MPSSPELCLPACNPVSSERLSFTRCCLSALFGAWVLRSTRCGPCGCCANVCLQHVVPCLPRAYVLFAVDHALWRACSCCPSLPASLLAAGHRHQQQRTDQQPCREAASVQLVTPRQL